MQNKQNHFVLFSHIPFLNLHTLSALRSTPSSPKKGKWDKHCYPAPRSQFHFTGFVESQDLVQPKFQQGQSTHWAIPRPDLKLTWVKASHRWQEVGPEETGRSLSQERMGRKEGLGRSPCLCLLWGFVSHLQLQEKRTLSHCTFTTEDPLLSNKELPVTSSTVCKHTENLLLSSGIPG